MEKIFNTTYHTCFCLYTPYPAHLFMLYVDHIYPDLSPERYKETKVKITALFSWYLSLAWMFLNYFFSLRVVHLLVSIVHYLPDDFYFLDELSTLWLAPSGKYFWPIFGVRNWSVHLFLRYLSIFDDFYSGSILQRLLFLEPKTINSRSIAHFLYQAQLWWFPIYFCGFSIVWWENLFMLNKSIKPWDRPIQGGQKERIFFPYWIYTKTFICTAPYIMAPSGQRVEFRSTKSMSVPTNKNLAAEIVPHIYIFDQYILSSSPKCFDVDHAGTL